LPGRLPVRFMDFRKAGPV